MKKIFFRVTNGETVSMICERYNIPQTHVIKTNYLNRELQNGDLVLLTFLESRVYDVQVTDTVESIAKKFNVDKEKILSENHLDYVFYGLKIFV